MSPPISSTVKDRVIQLHLKGKGRNELAEILTHSHIRISQGSVTNILNAWKREHGNSYASQPVASPEPEAKQEASSPGTGIGSFSLNRDHPPSEGPEAEIPVESFESEPLRGPLLRFMDGPKGPDQKTPSKVPSITPDKSDVTPAPTATTPNQESEGADDNMGIGIGRKQAPGIGFEIGMGSIFLPNPYGHIGHPNPFITTQPHMHLYFHPNSFTNPPSYSVSSEDVLEEEKHEAYGSQQDIGSHEVQVLAPEADGSQQDRLQTETEAQEVQTPSPSPSSEPETLTDSEPESPTREGPVSGWPRILREIKREKAQRHHELLLIERRRQKLEEWKRQIDQSKYDLEVREARCLEVEPFLPVARRLQDLKIGLEEAIPWLETIHEKAEAERVDQKTAAYRLAAELRLYRQIAGIQKAIERAQQQLSVLDMFTAQKQQALSMLMNLQAKGVTEAEIVNLVNFAGRWNKQWQYGLGIGQGNGDVNGGKNSNKTFKLDDKLNCVV
jgi:hypothetical protein